MPNSSKSTKLTKSARAVSASAVRPRTKCRIVHSAAAALIWGAWACSSPTESEGLGGTGGSATSTGGVAPATGGVKATASGASGPLSTGGVAAVSGGSTSTGGAVAPNGGSGPSQGGNATLSGGANGAPAGGTPSATGGSSNVGGHAGGGPASTGGKASGEPTAPGTFGKPKGTIPNAPQTADKVNLPKTDWKNGIISPSMQKGAALAQPSVVNGYLLIAGNEEFWFYDVSDPTAPKQVSSFKAANRTGGEAESHTVSFARYGDKFYMVSLGGRGIDTWDITDPTAPKAVGYLKIDGTSYGDYTNAIWGVFWEGQYIYVGATNNGIKVVDANNPADLKLIASVPTSAYGNVSAGPLDAIGNVLVVTTPKESGGVATLDISDPAKPTRLASLSASTSYIGQFYRRWVFLIGPIRAWDVLTNPKSIGSGTSPVGTLNTPGSEYLSFSDDYLFLGHVRAEIGGTPGASKITVADPTSMKITSTIYGRLDQNNKNDDQFNIAIGNLLVLVDDQAPYAGWFIAVHQTEPDTKAPVIDTVIPKDATTAVSTKSRIGVTFSDNIELATVNNASFVVRPVGGEPLSGKFGLRMGVVTFDPDEDLKPATTYEVVLPKGGVADLVGNALATEWKSTFTTN
jgi:hypothetical protein